MNTKEIKLLLIQRDLRATDLAAEFGCSKAQLSLCLNGKRVYPEIRKKLARKLKLKVDELFADPESDADQSRQRAA